MSKHIAVEDVDAFLANIKAADVDKKVDIVQFFGLTLEDAVQLPAHATDALTLLFPQLLRSSSHLLPLATLTSVLPFYIPLLPTTTPHALRLALHQLLTPLVEKLNDAKDKVHQAAGENVLILGRACYAADLASSKGKDKESLAAAWERGVKEGALAGKGWRAKVEALKMLHKMRADPHSGLPLKPWLPSLVDLLEDSDQHVREQAKETTIALLAPATTPPAARSELKKLLLARNVRKTIADSVINGVFNAPVPSSMPPTPSDTPRGQTPTEPAASADDIEAVYVASARDLENEFANMLKFMDGKETEQNWLPREQAAVRVRGMLRGRAFHQHPEAFVLGLRSGFMDGLVKILMSLRTTVAQCGCALVLDLAEQLKTAFDPCVESVLPTLGKMAGFTKRIIADKSQKDITAIITHTSAHARLFLPFILNGLSDKNVQTRQYFAGHLKTYLDVHSVRSKHAIENSHVGALEHIETALKKALTDVNPVVKELARAAFWSYEATWPQQGRGILDGMEGIALKQLEKANPKRVEGSSSPKRPVVAPRRGTSSVAAAIAAQRKAKAATLAAEKAQAEAQENIGNPDSPVQRATSSPTPRSTESSPVPSHSLLPLGQAHDSPTPAKLKSMLSSSGLGLHTPSPRASPSPFGAAPISTPTPRVTTSTLTSSVPSRSTPQAPDSLNEVSSTTPSRVADGPTAGPQIAPTPIGLDDDDEMDLMSWNKTLTPSRPSSSVVVDVNDPPVEEALRSQADQAVSTARQLLDFDDPKSALPPSTPLRAINGHSSALRTPMNPAAKTKVFQDSPQPGALTPAQLHRIQERVKTRRWWIRARRIPDRIGIPSFENVEEIVSSLNSGKASVDDLFALRRFAFEHSLTPSGELTVVSPSPLINTQNLQQTSRAVWRQEGLFDKLVVALLPHLDAKKPRDILEQATELLCDLVHNQWELMEDKDMAVCEATLAVRASLDAKIHDPTDAIMEYSARYSDPVYYAGTVLAALDRYLAANTASAARLSGFVLGLTALGRLVMRLPKEVAEDEAERFAGILYKAFDESSALVHESAMNLILALQSSLRDKERLFKLVPSLKQETRSLAMYYMSRLKLDDDDSVSVDDLAEELGKMQVEKRMNHLESRTAKAADNLEV